MMYYKVNKCKIKKLFNLKVDPQNRETNYNKTIFDFRKI